MILLELHFELYKEQVAGGLSQTEKGARWSGKAMILPSCDSSPPDVADHEATSPIIHTANMVGDRAFLFS